MTSLAIQALIDRQPSQGDVDAWVDEHRFPIVEGKSATFVWRGEADDVKLRHFIFGLESSQPLTRLPNTNLWYRTLQIPGGSRVEYKLEIIREGRGEWIQDPLNDRLARDPFGANSVLQTEGYEVPAWTEYSPSVEHGTFQPLKIYSHAFGEERGGQLYLPARFRDTQRYPLLVVHDGTDYLRYSTMGIVLDNLIDFNEIPRMVVAFIDSPDRLTEYANHEPHARFVAEELVPHLEAELPLRADPASRCLMGASFGGVASLSTAWRYPGFFGRLFLQSGSFAFTDIGERNHRGPVFDPVVAFMNKFRSETNVVSGRIFLSCGIYESLIYENRSLLPLLQERGMQAKLVESRDGHNWENWRDRLREGLSWLFPGPLMMIYE
ncbi:MAG: alpha/beta hydrolase-fold protein [Myxococcota bacterium]